MLAKFGEGPYDGVVLHLEESKAFIILPITIRTSIKNFERTVSGHCKYRLVTANDYELRYQFEAIRV